MSPADAGDCVGPRKHLVRQMRSTASRNFDRALRVPKDESGFESLGAWGLGGPLRVVTDIWIVIRAGSSADTLRYDFVCICFVSSFLSVVSLRWKPDVR